MKTLALEIEDVRARLARRESRTNHLILDELRALAEAYGPEQRGPWFVLCSLIARGWNYQIACHDLARRALEHRRRLSRRHAPNRFWIVPHRSITYILGAPSP